MQHNAIALHVLGARLDNVGELRIKGIRETNVTYDAAFEKGEWAYAFGAIDDLVRHHKVHRFNLLPQGADGRKGNNASHPEASQGGNVGSVGYFVRRKLVMQAMASKEGNICAIVRQDLDRGRRLTPGRDGVHRSNGLVALELAETSAANDGDVDGLFGKRKHVCGRRLAHGVEDVPSKVVGRLAMVAT